MADLSTILITDPADSESVSQGAARIRDTREAVITSFAGADAGAGSVLAEHYKKGAHKFPAGNGSAPGFAGAPTFGNANRLFIDTTNGRILQDTGATWSILRTQGAQITTNNVGGTTTTSYVDIMSLTVNVLGIIKMEVMIQFFGVSGGTVDIRGFIDGSTTMTSGARNYSIGSGTAAQFFYLDYKAGLSSGSHTFTVQIKGSAAGNVLWDNGLLITTQL